jgi:hypothetical protein
MMIAFALAGLALLAAPSVPQEGSFTTVTRESGIEASVDDMYAKNPKWWLSGLHLVDLDADGDLDLFLSAHGGGGALALLNDGRGHFSAAPGSYPSTEIHIACDIDEDGRPDLNMTHEDGGGRWWMNRSEPGNLAFEAAPTALGTNQARVNVLLDIDGDGRLDRIRSADGAVLFDIGDGKGGFAPAATSLRVTTGYRFEHAILPADIDGDGDDDLILEWGRYQFARGKGRLYRNDGGLKFTDVTAEAGIVEDGFSVKAVGDADQDGDPDLFVLENGTAFSLFLNDGRGKFSRKEGAIPGPSVPVPLASWGMGIVTDFDNDGIADVLMNGKHFLKILRGTGGGRFEYRNREWGIADVSASTVDDGLCFGDIDGDGDLDIVGYRTAGDQRRIDVYRNDLPRLNWIRVRPVGRPGNRAAAGAKIRLYETGTGNLLWTEEVGIFNRQEAHSYYTASSTERHFGLGRRDAVDVRVDFQPSGKIVRAHAAKAGRTLEIRE